MTIIIKNKTSKVELQKLLKKISKSNKKKSLRNVFGKFKIEGDALEIQKKLRNEWD
jgi:hypothetical protein